MLVMKIVRLFIDMLVLVIVNKLPARGDYCNAIVNCILNVYMHGWSEWSKATACKAVIQTSGVQIPLRALVWSNFEHTRIYDKMFV